MIFFATLNRVNRFFIVVSVFLHFFFGSLKKSLSLRRFDAIIVAKFRHVAGLFY